ncbi:protein translocase subunit SecD [uncultured Nevskia sp.]|uniref:protein translocase subunit SecD n=1 Tax=uncultured Nevskia sp. TaxID=228950 RepID=UPI0025D415B6|nr:protein translocase subunit SecD [uncultured Nevskia sp.]
MHQYPFWKPVTLIVVTLLGLLYALPNVYGEDPAVQISTSSGDPVPADFGDRIAKVLEAEKIEDRGSRLEGTQWVVRFASPELQLRAVDAIKRDLEGQGYVSALNLASKTPKWLSALGGKPMALGLDLRGGVHFLLQVAVEDVKKAAVERLINDVPKFLRDKDIRYSGRRKAGEAIVIEFADADRLEKARTAIAREYRELTLATPPDATVPSLSVSLSEVEAKRLIDDAVQKNLITLRNRVNQFGVAEPIVQRQGADRIVVQLPGVQDPTRVKELLGATATLEYRAVDENADAASAAASGVIPAGDELFYQRGSHRPYLLKRETIASGAELTSATPTIDHESGTPAVSVKLDGNGAKKMLDFTSKNVGKLMAVVYKETEIKTTYNTRGEAIRERRDVQEVISAATVRGVFGAQFQTTGLSSREARDLADLLKAGALVAPIEIIEERTIGPSLGADNIRRGMSAALLGLGLVMVFMVVYYRVFGLFAIAALTVNLLLLTAVLSLFQATLTMPGIAGIVLHMGIAVDANVLIYERIREELRAGLKPHQAIDAGYDRAFLTIADANVTVLIGTLILFFLGAGALKGFAITLAIGIVTSQFTAIVGSRTLAHWVFGKRQNLKDLPIW